MAVGMLRLVGSVGCQRTSFEQKPVNISFLCLSTRRLDFSACGFFYGSLLFVFGSFISQKTWFKSEGSSLFLDDQEWYDDPIHLQR